MVSAKGPGHGPAMNDKYPMAEGGREGSPVDEPALGFGPCVAKQSTSVLNMSQPNARLAVASAGQSATIGNMGKTGAMERWFELLSRIGTAIAARDAVGDKVGLLTKYVLSRRMRKWRIVRASWGDFGRGFPLPIRNCVTVLAVPATTRGRIPQWAEFVQDARHRCRKQLDASSGCHNPGEGLPSFRFFSKFPKR